MSKKKNSFLPIIWVLVFFLINEYGPHSYASQENNKKTPILEAEHFSSEQWAKSQFLWSDTDVGLRPFPDKVHVTRTEKHVSDIAHATYITRLAQLQDRKLIKIQEGTNRIDFILLVGAALTVYICVKPLVEILEPGLSEQDLKRLKQRQSELSADDLKALKESSRRQGTGKLIRIRLVQIILVFGGFALWILSAHLIYTTEDGKQVPSCKLVEHGQFLYIDNGLSDQCKVTFRWYSSDDRVNERIAEIPPMSLVQFRVPLGKLTVRAATKSTSEDAHLQIEKRIGFYVYDVFQKNEYSVESMKYK